MRFSVRALATSLAFLPTLLGAGLAPPGAAGDDKLTIEGRALDGDGKPIPGAEIFLAPLRLEGDSPPLEARAIADAEGRFRLGFPRSDLATTPVAGGPLRLVTIVARADGYGPGWLRLDRLKSGEPVELRLVRDDIPVEGMIADLAGRPLAGVVIHPAKIYASPEGRMDAFLEAFRDNPFEIFQILSGNGRLQTLGACPPVLPRELKTDDQGRFRLAGVGRDRVVDLEVEGRDIESLTVHVMTRRDVNVRNLRRETGGFQVMRESGSNLPVLLSARFHHIAGPTRPVVGTIREKGTGRPVAGASVFGSVRFGRESRARAETDAEGRYRLVGLPSEGKIVVQPGPAKRGTWPYLTEVVERTLDGAGRDPVTVDFLLARGVVFRGRLTDASTGKPVYGSVVYLAFTDNPCIGKYPGSAGPAVMRPDGSFEVVGLPGPGVVTVRAAEDRFSMSRPEQWNYPADDAGCYSTTMGQTPCSFFHKVIRVNPDEGVAEMPCNVTLDPGLTVRGHLVDADGRSVVGATALGLTALGSMIQPADAEFVATGLERDRPRKVYFFNQRRTLGRTVELPGDARGPVTVTLQPTGTLSGRVVDERGRPRPDVSVSCYVRARPFSMMRQAARTDAEGRFRFAGLLPDLTYEIYSQNAEPRAGLKVRMGDTRDLGDIPTGSGAAGQGGER
jgi:hypothetical protein